MGKRIYTLNSRLKRLNKRESMLLKPQTKTKFLEEIVVCLFTTVSWNCLESRHLQPNSTLKSFSKSLKFWIACRFAHSAGIVLNLARFVLFDYSQIRLALNSAENLFNSKVWKLKVSIWIVYSMTFRFKHEFFSLTM